MQQSIRLIGYFIAACAFYPTAKPELVQRNDFFRQVVGITEPVYRNLPDEQKRALITAHGQGNQRVYHLHNHNHTQTFQMGAFREYTLRELREMTRGSKKGGGTLHVVNGSKMTNKRYVDIGALQAMPENRDAVFQVASNFNGLETVSPNQNIDHQLLGEYFGDRTQGPFASISAFPGLMFRHYYMFYEQHTTQGSDYWRQRADGHDQVNLLDNLNTILPMSQAGYVRLNHAVTQGIYPTEQNLLDMKIGYHRDVQVLFGQLSGAYSQGYPQHERINDPLQIINQVFTAATDFGASNYLYRDNTIACRWGEMIIKLAYEGTIRLAAAMGKKRVILTLVGGGVFANPHYWIADAIYDMKEFIEKSGLQVFVSVFGGGQDPQIINEFKNRDRYDNSIIYWQNDTENPYLFRG